MLEEQKSASYRRPRASTERLYVVLITHRMRWKHTQTTMAQWAWEESYLEVDGLNAHILASL